jgi:ubiquinone/menaquinone biosynthesis C-methylase UbiE
MEKNVIAREVKNRFGSRGAVEAYYHFHKSMIDRFGNNYREKLKKAGFKKGKILDAACGFGGLALILANAFPGAEIIGVDTSIYQVELAKDLLSRQGDTRKVTFQVADVEKLPFADHSMDVIFNLNTAHLVDTLAMLNEFERILKPDGMLFIKDLRKSPLAVLEYSLNFAYTTREIRDIIGRSRLRKGKFNPGLIWWDYTVLK